MGVIPVSPIWITAIHTTPRARSDPPVRSRPDRGLRSACDGQDSPLFADVDPLCFVAGPATGCRLPLSSWGRPKEKRKPRI